MQIDSTLFKNNNVRVAMKLVLDREQLIKNVTLGFGIGRQRPLRQGPAVLQLALPQRVHDPEKATCLLKKAGVSKLDLTLPTSNAYPGMLEGAVAFEAVGRRWRHQRHDQAHPGRHLLRERPVPEDPVLRDVLGPGLRVAGAGRPAQELALQRDPLVRPEVGHGLPQGAGHRRRAARLKAYKALQVPLWERGGYMIPSVFATLDAVSSKVNGVVPNRSSGYQNLGGFEFKDHWLSA